MKFNTNNMAPMKESPDGCYYNPNRFISGASTTTPTTAAATAANQTNDTALGSWVRYIPTVFYTPVKTSARRPARTGTLDSQGVDDLNDAFANLLIGDPKNEEEAEETQEGRTVNFADGVQSYNDPRSEGGPKYGRFQTLAATHKSADVNVVRSYRNTK